MTAAAAGPPGGGGGREGDGGAGGAPRPPGGLLGYLVDRRKRSGAGAGGGGRWGGPASSPVAPEAPGGVGSGEGSGEGSGRGGADGGGVGRGPGRRLRYHDVVHGGSAFFGPVGHDDSDSDDDRGSTPKAGVGAALGAEAAGGASRSGSWLASFRTSSSAGREADEAAHQPAAPLSSSSSSSSSLPTSWASQAWQTVDSAREWVLATSSSSPSGGPERSSGGDSSAEEAGWTLPGSLAAALPSAPSLALPSMSLSSLNPFSDGDRAPSQPQGSGTEGAAAPQPSSSAFLPRFASRFEWATQSRNPYQAVIGRDADYLLSPPGAYAGVWSFFSWTSWLPWIVHGGLRNGHRQIDRDARNGNGNGHGGAATGRKKSRPSEASVRAVRDLISLVQHRAAIEGSSSPLKPPRAGDLSGGPRPAAAAAPGPSLPPRPSPPPLRSPRLGPPPGLLGPLTPSTPTIPDLAEGGPTFDSESSGNAPPRSSPVRSASAPSPRLKAFASPASSRPGGGAAIDGPGGQGVGETPTGHPPTPRTPSVGVGEDDDAEGRAMRAEMAARLAEGTLRAYRDLALDEATELHAALHHWTVRWERPLLGWIEAGPGSWFAEGGYGPPQVAGRKVSQIQAVLARRCGECFGFVHGWCERGVFMGQF
ncbi:hypothetical protein ACHAWF_010964 [Thalassiosira exigua]